MISSFHLLCAATLEGITLPQTVLVSGKTLTLNGIGVRTATMMKFKIFVMGLYLEKTGKNPAIIINSPQTKKVIQHYLVAIDGEKIKAGWSRWTHLSAHALEENLVETIAS